MLLGAILTRLETPAYSSALLEGLGDLVLMMRVETTGALHDENPGDYASGAVARFSGGASDEDWLALMTALERSDAPAATCLRRMVEWALVKDAEPEGKASGCSCGERGAMTEEA